MNPDTPHLLPGLCHTMVAMPAYGRSFTLASLLDTTVRAQAMAHGIPGPLTKDGGEPKTASLL